MKFGLFFPVVFASGSVLFSCTKDNTDTDVKQNDIAVIDGKITAWMTANGMPGASLAISRNGKLVYRKGYGVTDPASGEKVAVDSRFRMASVSKTITSAAILKLVQDGKLSLNQKVFGAGAILGTTYGTQPYKTYVTDITVDHLLHQTFGGWGTNAPGDPAFYDSSMSHTALINWTLDNNPLVNAPGTTYRYSNFGFILLARIIEKVSGKTYEDYVKTDILNPLGAVNTFIAGNNAAQRKTNEVTYKGQAGDIPYVYALYNYSRADGAFGWISTPTDMLRFLTAIDSSATRPDLLNGATLKTMVTTTAANVYYGCGWAVEGPEWYWFGSLPGTASVIYRNSNGLCVSFVANSRLQPDPNNALNGIAGIINEINTNTAIKWQNIDQF
ncbi:MAG: serine hydrolase domain-containing protein [Ferruginibacter sp.]